MNARTRPPTLETPAAGADPASARPGLRADAARNRERILAAADDAFAEVGLAVPVDEIARRAGVGTGTLYRHFPTKEALFEAVVLHYIEEMTGQARDLAAADDAGAAFFEFLRRMAEEGATRRNLFEALQGVGIDIHARAGEHKAQLEAAMEALLRRAQAAGAVRPDVTLPDLVALVVGVCSLGGAEVPACSQARLFDVVCDGLRAPARQA